MREEEHINLQSSALELANHRQHWQLWSTEPLVRAGLCCRSLSATGTHVTMSASLEHCSSPPACHANGDWCERSSKTCPHQLQTAGTSVSCPNGTFILQVITSPAGSQPCWKPLSLQRLQRKTRSKGTLVQQC